MSTATEIKASIRSEIGKKYMRKIRATGQIPGVLYGHRQENENICIPSREFQKAFYEGARVFFLQFGSKKELALVKDVQYDLFSDSIVHLDFNRIDMTEKIEIHVPLTFKGPALGEKEGGILDYAIRSITIECLPMNIPTDIKVDLTNMKLDDILTMGQIVLPEGMALKDAADKIVATCALRHVDEEKPLVGEVTAPEILTEKKKEEGEASAKEEKK